MGKLGQKPWFKDRETEIIKSFQLHISHERRLYLVVKVILGHAKGHASNHFQQNVHINTITYVYQDW